ncbi:Zn-ribbon domain-containing OB-fold protein [Mycobacterium sp. SMC-4]|uniref:Zn-ribbon domain-containing OB-fold protein n=1 Tax=Mycobacterium sp. SMC-4 TaxID=2857059 RepID=UPI0021B3759E|nr:OB-fold domain-containing protein [Mycobacterium sp. SMC-4]UXA19259.1 OB-fold domain-containing protein [Mycobacterium sp. SMC-4]
MAEQAPTSRPLPALTALNRPYWTSGADGVWSLQRCPDCERLIHPPTMRCQYDHAVPEWVALSGRGVVESWTVNHHPFFPGIPTPYVIAFVNPVEDERVRVLTNLVNVQPEEVFGGMPVQVTFAVGDDGGDDVVHLPLFTPER